MQQATGAPGGQQMGYQPYQRGYPYQQMPPLGYGQQFPQQYQQGYQQPYQQMPQQQYNPWAQQIGFQSDLNDPFLLRKSRYCTGHTMDLHSCYDQFTQFPHLMIPESQNVGLHFLL